MIRRNSLILFMVAIVTVFTLVSCSATTKGGDFDPIAVPYSYSFTEIDENTLTLRLFVGSKDSKFTNPDNYSRLELVSGNDRLEVRLSGEIFLDNSLGKINKRDIYMVDLPLILGVGAGFEMSDAYLAIQWRNGETEELYLGDISFVLVDDTPIQDAEITFCVVNPIGHIGERDCYSLPALELRVAVSRDILLTKVDLALSKYGIDQNKILVFNQEADIQKIEDSIGNKSIFVDYPSHFSLATTNAPSYDIGELLLTEGDNLVILPLVSSVSNYNTIIETGAKLTYTVDGIEKNHLVPQKLLFNEFFWTVDAVKELAERVGN